MTALYEVSSVRQIAGEYRRRWFTSTSMDLYVWYDVDALVGFQITYDKGGTERALTWKAETGFVHDVVDDGESQSGSRHKATPVLYADSAPDIARVVEMLTAGGARVPADIVSFVAARMRDYPGRAR